MRAFNLPPSRLYTTGCVSMTTGIAWTVVAAAAVTVRILIYCPGVARRRSHSRRQGFSPGVTRVTRAGCVGCVRARASV